MTVASRHLLIALMIFAPAAASAQETGACAALYRRLNDAPTVIGTTTEVHRYTQELAQVYNDIRQIRIDLRRARCSVGSVVVFGTRDNGDCKQMQTELRSLEQEREAIKVERDNIRQALVRPSDERAALLAAIDRNGCSPADIRNASREDLRVRGLELPDDRPQSGVTGLRPRQEPKPETRTAIRPPPARPYDPDRKVRMVGPVFLPEDEIDLANPRSTGPQKQQ